MLGWCVGACSVYSVYCTCGEGSCGVSGVGVSGSDLDGVRGCFFVSGRPAVEGPPSSVHVCA